jgi:uncharacterized protein DUF6134
MKKIIFLALLFISYHGFSQKLLYTISSKKKQLGSLIVEKTKKDSVYQIEVFSNVNFRFFIKIALDYKLNCTYYENELLRSYVTTYVNGKENSSVKTEKKDNYYEVTEDGETSKFYNTIGLSGALSYFKEPINMSTIYSDFYGYDKNIEIISDHVYKVTNPKNGQISEYFYENGILNKAIIHHFLMTFTLQLVQVNDKVIY